MIPGWSSTKVVQIVPVGCISRSWGQKIGFQNAIFKNLLVWNYNAQSFYIWYIASSRGPLPKLFKLFPWGQTQQTFYIGPTSARYWILYRPDNGCRYRPDVGCAADIVPTFKGHRFFSLKLPFLLLKPCANKIGKEKTGECINFNKFIYTNLRLHF